MDYETVSIKKPCHPNTCWVDTEIGLGWEKGEITEIRITICGDFVVGETLISVEDFLVGSNTKSLKMVLRNYLGEEVNTQIVPANELEYFEGKAAGYYVVDQILSEQIKPGSYQLFVYMVNTLPEIEGKLPERTILNMLVSDQDGIDITVT